MMQQELPSRYLLAGPLREVDSIWWESTYWGSSAVEDNHV